MRQIQLIIAGLVNEATREGKGVNEAQRDVAAFLETSVPTVKRACRAMRGDDAVNAESNLEVMLWMSDESRALRKKIIDSVRICLAEIAAARGK
jgi:hypothetical protein